MKAYLFACFIFIFCIIGLPDKSYAGKDPNILKTGVSYVLLTEYDSQGAMFYNDLSHYIGDRVAMGFNFSVLNASRFDQVQQIFSIKNSFYTGSFHMSLDMVQNQTITLRAAAGPTFRHRAEINSSADNGTIDGSVRHIRTADIGGLAFIENDFNLSRYGVAGGRIAYYYYTKGTPVFAVGFHVGFVF
jgi:hypothetical protein